MKEDGMISKRGYNMAHFSKFVRPGYVRIDATKNPEPNVYVSAYKGDNKVVIVAINKNNTGSTKTLYCRMELLRKYPDGSRAAAAIFNLERISK